MCRTAFPRRRNRIRAASMLLRSLMPTARLCQGRITSRRKTRRMRRRSTRRSPRSARCARPRSIEEKIELGQLLKIACWDYDRVNALRDGRAKIEGCDIAFTVNAPHNFFLRTGESPPYDVMEQSFSSYLTRRSRGPVPYTAIPIYPSRIFRHSAIYIRTDRGIRAPADLKGKRIGVPFYGITAVTTARGIL